MLISTRWLAAALLTFVIGFTVLGYLAYRVYDDSPPIPQAVVGPDGEALFSGADIIGPMVREAGLMKEATFHFYIPTRMEIHDRPHVGLHDLSWMSRVSVVESISDRRLLRGHG